MSFDPLNVNFAAIDMAPAKCANNPPEVCDVSERQIEETFTNHVAHMKSSDNKPNSNRSVQQGRANHFVTKVRVRFVDDNYTYRFDN